MDDNAMKPCPFCGSFAVFEPRLDYSIIRCSRRNDGCPVNMRTHKGFATFQEAKAAWNTRATITQEEPSE
jgi:hypothetical protein